MGNESLTNGHSHEMAGKATRMAEKPLTTKPLTGNNSNGSGNGVTSYHDSYADYEADESTVSFSAEQQVTVLHESVITVRRKFINELDDVEDSSIESVAIENVLEYIERQRLIHMPHRGSHWDKVLKWAEFFALQVSRYATAAERFVSESKVAAKLIWTASKSLLDLGPDNAMALEIAFGQFYRLGLSISSLLRDNTLLSASNEIQREVGQSLNILLLLVRDVTFYYRLRLRSSAQETSFDFNGAFGGQIAIFQKHKNHIVDAMWKQALGDEAAAEYRLIRKWLGPHDASLQKMLKDEEFAPGNREEFTCEWFQSHLLSFSRGKSNTLAVHAPAGCGKSVLSKWIVERLQRPIGKKSYVTLSCTLETDAPTENSSVSVVKRLLLQMLEINIGHIRLFEDLAAARRAGASSDVSKVEDLLWKSLGTGVRHMHDNSHTMIIVDGLDEIRGGEKAATAVVNKLGSLSAEHSHIQLITMSRYSALKPGKGKIDSFQISPDHTHEDLRAVIDHNLSTCKYFRSRSEHGRENLVEQVLHAAKGNFLWAILTAELVKRESSSEDSLNRAVKAAKEAPSTLDATITKLTNNIDFSKPEPNLLMSLMLVANRPLTLLEIKQLTQIDLANREFRERKSDIKQEINAAFGMLVTVRNNFVRFSHSTVRSHMIQIQEEGKRMRSRQWAQSDMVTRLLAYCHFNLPATREPVFDLAEKHETDNSFSSHALLEYAVRNWTIHFQSSTMCQKIEALQLSEDFKAMFPTSTQIVVLEWTCWESDTSEALNIMDMALRVRRAALPENNGAVLQNLIVCGNLWRGKKDTTRAADCFYSASVIGQQILNKFHTVTASCTTVFLTITESMTVSSRTEVATQKEKMLIYTIDMYKHQHGKTHDLVIHHYKKLAQLYVAIHEEHRAETIWRELREIVIIRFGKGSEEEISISESLTVVLKRSEKKTDVIEYEQGIFDIITELDVWNIRRIKHTIELALSYEARGELLLAEETFVILWRRLTEECRHSHHHHGVDIHIHVIDVVIEYVRFLQRCDRYEEASNVLICIWTEYEEYDFESEIIFLRLKIVGELMRTVSLLSVAVSVFRKCWAWFRSHGKQEHAASCETLITATVERMEITTTKTTTTKSGTSTITSETVMKEIVESTLSSSTINKETISVCKSLISHYMESQQWVLAIETSKTTLLVIWRSVISGNGTIALPRDFSAGAIDIAISLAICYRRSQHFYDAEQIYIRVYRACRNSCRITDERLETAYTTLVKFYEDHKHWHKMIEIHQELLEEYRRHVGASHQLTIRTLYILGSLTAEHGHGHTVDYFEEIVRVLNHDSHICHHDAIKAMTFICQYHYEAGHWHKLQKVCKVLWETWKGQHQGHDQFTVEFVEKLYLRYRYVLEHHVHCELTVLREFTMEYRNTCRKIYGVTATITLMATYELAQICMRSEKHIHEAITMFEEVLTHTKSTTTQSVISTMTITSVRQRLTEAYVSVCKHESVSSTTIERAVKVLIERYEHLRVSLGWAHVETLTTLREVILLHIKSKKQDSHAIVIGLLLEASTHIIIKEKHSQILHEAGRTLGDIFLSFGLSQVALEVIQEIRLQITTGAVSPNNKHGIKVDRSAGRLCFVFLITLQQVINGASSISYSEAMADYLTESILYESYARSTKSSATVIIGHVARLRAFLSSHERNSQREVLERQSYDIFIKKWSINTRSREIGMLFYVSLLIQIGDSVRDVEIGNVACSASVTEVRRLLNDGQVHKAYEVAECALDFITHHRSYHQLQNIGAGFGLSSLMAGRGIDRSIVAKIEPKLRESMYELSRKVIREVLQACKDSKIDFVRLKLHELNDLVGLLGEQQNFVDLEYILTLLWASREVQKTWSPPTIIALGRLLVCARYLTATTASTPNKQAQSSALRLCEDIVYNMRRTWGSLDPKTLEMSTLLSSLYTSMGHHREAQGVHENILRLVTEGDDGDDRTLDTMTPERALAQLELLKQTFLRLHGWDKSPEIYTELVHELKSMPEYKGSKALQAVPEPKKWNPKEPADEAKGTFQAPREWVFVAGEVVGEDGVVKEGERRSGMGLRRATSNWGLGFVQGFLGGQREETNGGAMGGGRCGGASSNGFGNGNGNGKVGGGKKNYNFNGDEKEGGYEGSGDKVHIVY